jgi:signal transduction histidine kinase
LLRLAAREAVRNVKRHAGTAKCQLRIDLSECPYVLRARDWGAGIDPASQAGNGIERLRNLAASLGGELAIGSQPGMGTVLVLVGRRCPNTRVRPALVDAMTPG